MKTGLLCLLLVPGQGLPTASHAQPPAALEAEVSALVARSRGHIASARDSAALPARQAIALADSSGNAELRTEALLNMGFAYFRWSALDSARHYNQQALDVSREAGYTRGAGRALNRLGNVLWLQDDQAEAKICYEGARAIHVALDDPKEIGRSLNNLATVYRQWGDYQQAIQLYLEARTQYDRVGYEEGVAWLDFSLTILHKKLGDWERALESITASLATYRELAAQNGDSAGVMICYGQLGDIYNQMGHPEQGLEYHLRALRMREETGVQPAIADGLTGVGKSYYALGEYDRALTYFQRSQEVRQAEGTARGKETNLKYMGAIYRNLGKTDEALSQYRQALAVARELNERATESEVLGAMADSYAETGQYQEAWRALREHGVVQDQVMSVEISKRVASIQFGHQIEAKEAENQRLQRENRIRDIQLESSRTQNLLVAVLAAFAVAIHRGGSDVPPAQASPDQDAAGVDTHLRPLQEDQERPGILRATGKVHHVSPRGPVQPRHLRGLRPRALWQVPQRWEEQPIADRGAGQRGTLTWLQVTHTAE